MLIKNEIVHSLHQLTEYPPDLRHPIYREYPFFKLGVTSGVQYFSERLTPLVEKIMAANPDHSRWALTSPATHRIPTAANLLCLDIYERLKKKSSMTKDVSIVKLFNIRNEDNLHENSKNFSNYNKYSTYTWEERLTMIRKYHFIIQEEDFRNRGIVFINDINVTGASREYISQVFAKVYPGKINWLYIIDCDKTVGQKNPELEYEINNSSIRSVVDFGAILSRDDIQHTSKCISKLFSYSTAELEQLLEMLDSNQKLRLWDSVQREDLYQGDIFKEKMTWLREHC